MVPLLACLSLCSTLTDALMPPQPFLPSTWILEPRCPVDSGVFHGSVGGTYANCEALSSTLLTFEDISHIQISGVSARNIVLVTTIVVFFLAGAKFLYSSYILPEGAKQLEAETKDLAPKLWKDVKNKIGDDEKLAERPDLMQELFKKIQPFLLKEIATQMEEEISLSEEKPAPRSDHGIKADDAENDAETCEPKTDHGEKH